MFLSLAWPPHVSPEMFQLELSVIEKMLRPIIVYFFLVAALRVFGKRELAQLNPFDLVVLLSLSNTVQNAIIGDDNTVTGGLIGALTLLGTNYLVVRFLFRHRRLDQIVEGSPTVADRERAHQTPGGRERAAHRIRTGERRVPAGIPKSERDPALLARTERHIFHGRKEPASRRAATRRTPRGVGKNQPAAQGASSADADRMRLPRRSQTVSNRKSLRDDGDDFYFDQPIGADQRCYTDQRACGWMRGVEIPAANFTDHRNVFRLQADHVKI